VISPQLARTSRETGEPNRSGLVALRDRGNQVAQKFGLVFTLPEDLRKIYRDFGIDLAKANGDDSWTLPMPARYVIDQTGTIRAADVDPDYTRRTEPSATVAALRALGT
jgi:peroxiredoxin